MESSPVLLRKLFVGLTEILMKTICGEEGLNTPTVMSLSPFLSFDLFVKNILVVFQLDKAQPIERLKPCTVCCLSL